MGHMSALTLPPSTWWPAVEAPQRKSGGKALIAVLPVGATPREWQCGMPSRSMQSFAYREIVDLREGGIERMSSSNTASRAFPDGFVWGAATAGHQIEGNNVNADFWFLENLTPTTFVERSGDACDSYHRYEEDIALLAGLGLGCYRFSIEWSRIEPSRGFFSPAELDHYKRMIECCHSHGVLPAVTF